MKKILQLALAALALLPALPARASWPATYTDGDVLLIFRKSSLPTYPSTLSDVEFDLGSVTNFLGHPNGYTNTVSGFSLGPVTSVFGSDLTGVSVVLVAATSPTNASPTAYFSAALPQSVWLNGVEPYHTASAVSPSVWQTYWSTINSIGTRPKLYLPKATLSALTSFTAATKSPLSYDYIVSSTYYVASFTPNAINLGNSIQTDWLPQFGGSGPFTVEGVAPGSFGFLAVPSSTAAVKPLDTYIGSFTIDAAGNLTFTAGPPAPVLTGITRSGGSNTVSFSTVLSGNYSLIYTNSLGGSSTNWPAVGSSLVGDGNLNSLTHTVSDSAGFYKVVRNP